MIPKLKICGMKHNTEAVAALDPDYLGFIFYDKSPRNFEGEPPFQDSVPKKVGVFVDASLEAISEIVKTHGLDVVQLHGNESSHFCAQLKNVLSNSEEIWKVFSVGERFNFEKLDAYELVTNKFLFDTQGAEKGGTGRKFDWTLLENYPSKKPFILSGGIGPNDAAIITSILATNLPIYAIDLNSKFETAPGSKDISALKAFIDELSR